MFATRNRIVSAACLALAVAALVGSARAQDWATEEPASTLSAELATGAVPGGDAQKGKLVRLGKTEGGARDGRPVVVYTDANRADWIWSPRGAAHHPGDVFARWSDDDGASWSDPVNISNTANSYSAATDWDGDGVPEPYWGDSSKPTIFSSGDDVVVSWTDKYCPEPDWAFGQSGISAVQGVVEYADLAVYPHSRAVPYAGVWVAVSNDGGDTWVLGDAAHHAPPLQLTYGRRDAIQDAHRGSGGRWVMTWQEDPAGLQPGEAEGPGIGASGAKASKGTDIWYAYTPDVEASPELLRDNRTPLSNHSRYDTAAAGGFPMVGNPGVIENHAGSRANLFLVKDGAAFRAIVAYEETKGVEDVLYGKTIQYHCFDYAAPFQGGTAALREGGAGTTLTDLLENARRVRLVVQSPNGADPAICIFWKQGLDAQGAPSDILLKVATSLGEAAVAAAPTWNISAQTPSAGPGNLLDPTMLDPYEDSRAHRAYLRGAFLIVGYSYTRNQALARYTDLENYDFWVRRSFDGGQTWDAPRNLSELPTSLSVTEPRIVGPANTGGQHDGSFVVAWGTETNVYETGSVLPEPVDIQVRRTRDFGESYTTVMTLDDGTAAAGGDVRASESQLRVDDDASTVYATWMSAGAGATEYRFTRLHHERFTPGDRLDLTFSAPGEPIDVAFDGLEHMRLRLRFPAAVVKAKVRVSVFVGDGSPAGLVESFVAKAGKKAHQRLVHLPVTGPYRVRFERLAGGDAPICCETGRLLPGEAKARTVALKPKGAPFAEVGLLGLRGTSLDLDVAPKSGSTGPLSLALLGPDGAPLALDGHLHVIGDVSWCHGLPLPLDGAYVLRVGGFGSGKQKAKVRIAPDPPLPGAAVHDIVVR